MATAFSRLANRMFLHCFGSWLCMFIMVPSGMMAMTISTALYGGLTM